MREGATVVGAHRGSNPDPIVVNEGEEVTVGKRDDRWPEYLWCTSAAGRSGWVHERFLQREEGRVVASAAYDAHEMTVRIGEVVTVIDEAGGWYLCNRGKETGWVPAACLRLPDTSAP